MIKAQRVVTYNTGSCSIERDVTFDPRKMSEMIRSIMRELSPDDFHDKVLTPAKARGHRARARWKFAELCHELGFDAYDLISPRDDFNIQGWDSWE